MSNLTERAENAIAKYSMIKNGDTVIVACSGGADSVALFHFLFTHKDTFGITLRAVHVNHRLRGDAADKDEAYVRSLCDEYAVPLDVAMLTPPQNPSEQWARIERYKVFDALITKYGAKIATAHTENDLAETVLFNIARGAGIHGAAGIPPVRGAYIRPLITSTREHVEEYDTEHNLKYVTDATNLTHDYARNRIRLSVLPAFETVHGNAVQSVARFAENAAEAAQYFDDMAIELLQNAKLANEDNAYDAKTLLQAHSMIRKSALRLLIRPYADATRPRISIAENCLHNGGAVQISDDIIISVKQGILRTERATLQLSDWKLPLTQGTFTSPDGRKFAVNITERQNIANFDNLSKKSLKFYADYDRIDNKSILRTRQGGDTFCMAGRGVTKALKDIFSEAKLSQQQRYTMPVLANGSEILWVYSMGFAQSISVTSGTKNVLTIDEITEE